MGRKEPNQTKQTKNTNTKNKTNAALFINEMIVKLKKVEKTGTSTKSTYTIEVTTIIKS